MTDGRLIKADNSLLAARRRLDQMVRNAKANTTTDRVIRAREHLNRAEGYIAKSKFAVGLSQKQQVRHAILELNRARRVPLPGDLLHDTLKPSVQQLEDVERDL